MAGKSDIVRSLFDAYRSKDRALLDRLLSDDFRFTSPYDDAIDKAAYFSRCWPASISYIKSNTVEKISECGDEVFVQYKCVTNDGKEFRNVECHTFDGGRVRAVNVYFGATYKDGNFVKMPGA
jgi:ketosteroid isomerase-like protein